MAKILFFDYWTKGIRNFTRLNPTFVSKGHETILVHLESFSNKNIKREYVKDGLKVRDISYYKTIFFKKVLIEEKPDAIILLNYSFIFDRALLNFSKKFSFKVFFLAHGQVLNPLEVPNVVNKTKLSRISKKNIFSIFNYYTSISNKLEMFPFLYKVAQKPAYFTLAAKYDKELSLFDKCFVYYKKDFTLFINQFHFPKEKMEILGNPEFDVFVNTEIKNKNEFFLNEFQTNEVFNYVLYLDDGLNEEYHGWSTKMWLEHIIEINENLENKNKLVIKAHPRRELTEELFSFFRKNNIILIQDCDFKNIVYNSSFVITLFSSTAVYPLILRKPIVSPRIGYAQGLPELYPSFIFNYCYDIDKFTQIQKKIEVNLKYYEDYLNENFGDLSGQVINSFVKKLEERLGE